MTRAAALFYNSQTAGDPVMSLAVPWRYIEPNPSQVRLWSACNGILDRLDQGKCPVTREYQNNAPWRIQPVAARRVQQTGTALANTLATTTALIRYVVPQGWSGVIKGIMQFYQGTGFVEGSGDIVWRLRVNSVYPIGYGDMRTTLGSTDQPNPVLDGIRVSERQVVEYSCQVTGGSVDPSGRVVVGLFGWIYPMA